jgi:hypothetical protein
MRRLAVGTALLAFACSRETRPDPKPGQTLPARLIGCAIQAPDETGRPMPEMSADFLVDTRGKVHDIRIRGPQGPDAKALRRHLESCQYAPATKHGHPVATRRAVVYGLYR